LLVCKITVDRDRQTDRQTDRRVALVKLSSKKSRR